MKLKSLRDVDLHDLLVKPCCELIVKLICVIEALEAHFLSLCRSLPVVLGFSIEL